MNQKLSKCCHAPVDDLIEVDQSWSTICRKCQHRCEVEEPTQGEEFDWSEVIFKLNNVADNTDTQLVAFIKTHCVPRKAWEHERIISKANEDAAQEYLAKLAKAESDLISAYAVSNNLIARLVEAEGKLEKVRKLMEDVATYGGTQKRRVTIPLNEKVKAILTPSPREEKSND